MTNTPVKTKSQEAAADVRVLLKARNPLLWIVTREETRVEGHLFATITALKLLPRTWDVGQGVVMGVSGKPVADTEDIGAALKLIRASSEPEAGKPKERGVWILRDLPVWLDGVGGARTLREVRNLVKLLPGVPLETSQAMIVLSPSGNIPPELAGHTTVIEWPMPDRTEIAGMLDTLIDQYNLVNMKGNTREAAIDAAVGLNGEEVQSCYSKSLVQLKCIDPVAVGKEKRRVITRERVLEWYDPLPGGLDSVGGLGNLKSWLIQRKLAYGAKAREYGLPPPKGTLIVGISGCGKSLTAKAVSTAYEVPLLRVDLGALKSKFVGESESNLRKAFDVIAAIGRCVVWFDEIEKSLQGATSGSADGGVSSDALGAILSWMQERQGEAFVIATANDITGLPPELLRKGRFDELWFVDLPNPTERVEVLKTALRSHGREAVKIDFNKVASATDQFTGAEIAALVPDALFHAFADKAREITTADLVIAAASVTPLSKTAAKKISDMREWGKENARQATAQVVTATNQQRVRMLDLEEEL